MTAHLYLRIRRVTLRLLIAGLLDDIVILGQG